MPAVFGRNGPNPLLSDTVNGAFLTSTGKLSTDRGARPDLIVRQ